MSWDHRIVRRTDIGGTESGEWLMICEVYYDDTGLPAAFTDDVIGVVGENLEELRQTLEWMQKAIEQPILNEATDFIGDMDADREVYDATGVRLKNDPDET